jgi:hypothetical protein
MGQTAVFQELPPSFSPSFGKKMRGSFFLSAAPLDGRPFRRQTAVFHRQNSKI